VTGAVVLAAGASTRMGSPKALLTTAAGTTFLQAILATLREAGVESVRVVVAPGAGTDATHVINPEPARGMLSSVQCGLRALPEPCDAVLLWPVDHPLVRVSTVAAMLDAFRSGDPPVVVPTHDGRRGHPVLFARRLVPELLAADPALGARAVVHAHADRLELTVEDRGVLADVDTREDYRRLVAGATVSRSEVS
jgi:molybdenum cofactor cytidylyltransferase